MAYIGLHVPSFTYPGVPPASLFGCLVDIATTAESSGFTALSVMDHFHQITPHGSPEEPMLEAYTTLGAIGAPTTRLELLTLVTGVVYHNPAHLAKQVTTLDVISGGRAILVSGTPDEIAERLAAFRAAGADGTTMSIHGVHELRPIELVARAAVAAFS